MKYWFIPTWSGDFRLEAIQDDDGEQRRSILRVEDPTSSELVQLDKYLEHARKSGWIEAATGISRTGRSEVPLSAPIEVTGPVLAVNTLMGADVWTAIRSRSGVIEVLTGTEIVPTPKGPELLSRTATATEEAISKTVMAAVDAVSKTTTVVVDAASKTAAAAAEVVSKAADEIAPVPTNEIEVAATVRKPGRGCPEPEPCARRASEVLRCFCTRTQWTDWLLTGSMRLIGNHTGRLYRLFHRDEAAKRGLTRVLWDTQARHVVCVYHPDLPADEEALAIKMAVEHKEAWLRSF